MLSVIIPTWNIAEAELTATLEHCYPFGDLLSEIVIVDGGSATSPETWLKTRFAADYAAKRLRVIYSAKPVRGEQLRLGALAAMEDWFLFLHADTQLGKGWQSAVRDFMARYPAPTQAFNKRRLQAGVFRLKLRDTGWRARITEWGAGLRYWLFALPYGDQGLLICREHYFATSGYASIPLMEDVKMVRRVSRSGLHRLPAHACTSAARYHNGYVRRWLKNLFCLLLFYSGMSPKKIRRFYD